MDCMSQICFKGLYCAFDYLIVIKLIVNESTIENKSKVASEKLTRKISPLFGHSSSFPLTSLSYKHHKEPKFLRLCYIIYHFFTHALF